MSQLLIQQYLNQLQTLQRVPFGYWKAKDTKDDLDEEIQKRLRRGYPQDNIIFEDSQQAVLALR
ncbi:MAG: hypothetical protein ACT4PS_09340 [Betaproteobacteria bacterium]